MATMPQAMVSVGSHSLGEVRLRMMLHGICVLRQPILQTRALLRATTDLKQDISDEIERQPREILVPGCILGSARPPPP